MADHIQPTVEAVGSLATQMTQRALDEERLRKERAEAKAREDQVRADQAAEELRTQIRAGAERQVAERELAQRARRQADIALPEVTSWPTTGEMPMETFNEMIRLNGVKFDAVRLFHARQGEKPTIPVLPQPRTYTNPECLGTTYLAEPVCDDPSMVSPLELHAVLFKSHYYTTSQGRKKLKQLESELQRLARVRDENLLSVYAVKLALSTVDGSSRLVILCDQRPSVSLRDLLADADAIREERAIDYLGQILSALQAVHRAEIVHRGAFLVCLRRTSVHVTT
jgi:eukaryotic translation initiation factor 2-alpha kinase 4